MLPPILLPAPRRLELTGGYYHLGNKKSIAIAHDRPYELLFTALWLKKAIQSFSHQEFDITAGQAGMHSDNGITLQVITQSPVKPQGYRLRVTHSGINIEAGDGAGAFYACCTLSQMIQHYSLYSNQDDLPEGSLPCMEIVDWPDFPNRGVMLDISRDKVPTIQTTLALVDLLASWKINQLQLYTEHTFAYRQHPQVWAKASPFTGEEILQLDAYCRERFIEMVPNQNSFGHLEHWLRLPEYMHLAEAPEGFDFPWGHHEGPFSLCPLDGGSLSLLRGLYDELLPHFSSRQFNVGCDETFDLGQGRSNEACERLGTGRVYLDFLLKIYQEVKQRGFRMQFWGDIIMDHPELVGELPKDSIALEWGYEADHPFEEHGAMFARAGLSFYVCPGSSSWNSIAGRTDNCLGNLSNAAVNGLEHGADGYLITDWGDNGHWQALPVSYLGFAAGAAYSWCWTSNAKIDIQEELNEYAYQDPSRNMGKLAYQLGNVYRQMGFEPTNSSALFHILQRPFEEWKGYMEQSTAIGIFHDVLSGLEQIDSRLSTNTSQRQDKELLDGEFRQSVDLLRHACIRGLYFYDSGEFTTKQLRTHLKRIVEVYQQIWLQRNRSGGLEDSLAYFTRMMDDYPLE
jgi:hexosaminidase